MFVLILFDSLIIVDFLLFTDVFFLGDSCSFVILGFLSRHLVFLMNVIMLSRFFFTDFIGKSSSGVSVNLEYIFILKFE